MVRGVNKQVVVIRDTGSDMFEQAILIVNPKSKKNAGSDIASEAKLILERYINRYYSQQPDAIQPLRKKHTGFRLFGWLSLITAAVAFIYFLLFRLFILL